MSIQKPIKLVDNHLLRILLIGIGWLAIILGVIGIFVPVMPTVPFLLLAAACFARSSERFHSWLIDHKYLGPLIRSYLGGTGMPLRAKISALTMIWISLLISAFLLVHLLWVRLLLIGIGICLTFYLLRLPTSEEDEEPPL
jgi:uncharacterized membrane protein YbaN (DUF454 family)